MLFLADENIPEKLTRFLVRSGHSVEKAVPQAPDQENIRKARSEKRIIITLDKDFEILYAKDPSFGVILFRIHPPYADLLIKSFERLIGQIPEIPSTGLILLTQSGHIRVE